MSTTTSRQRNSSLGTRNYEEEDSSYMDDSFEDADRTFDTPGYDDDTTSHLEESDDDVGQVEITPPSEFSPTHLITPMNKRGKKTRT